MNQLNNLFLDPNGETPLTQLYADFTGEDADYHNIVYEKKWLVMQEPEVEPVNAIEEELKGLHYSITHDEKPAVTAEEATRALNLAHRIVDAMPALGDKFRTA